MPDEDIERITQWAIPNQELLLRLLAERELLVAEHNSLGPDRHDAHQAVEAFR